MAIDAKKSLNIAMIPIGILVVIGIVTNVIGAIPFLNLLLCLVGLPLTLVSWAVMAWAGYKSVKEAQMDLVGGAVTGAITGAVGGLINAIIGFVFSLLHLGASAASGNGLGAMIGAGIGIVAIILAPIFGAIIGAIFGAIGAFVAGMKK